MMAAEESAHFDSVHDCGVNAASELDLKCMPKRLTHSISAPWVHVYQAADGAGCTFPCCALCVCNILLGADDGRLAQAAAKISNR